eukprot:scaffold6716_cov114-Isochrysis_galbana.AAC.5
MPLLPAGRPVRIGGWFPPQGMPCGEGMHEQSGDLGLGCLHHIVGRALTRAAAIASPAVAALTTEPPIPVSATAGAAISALAAAADAASHRTLAACRGKRTRAGHTACAPGSPCGLLAAVLSTGGAGGGSWAEHGSGEDRNGRTRVGTSGAPTWTLASLLLSSPLAHDEAPALCLVFPAPSWPPGSPEPPSPARSRGSGRSSTSPTKGSHTVRQAPYRRRPDASVSANSCTVGHAPLSRSRTPRGKQKWGRACGSSPLNTSLWPRPPYCSPTSPPLIVPAPPAPNPSPPRGISAQFAAVLPGLHRRASTLGRSEAEIWSSIAGRSGVLSSPTGSARRKATKTAAPAEPEVRERDSSS